MCAGADEAELNILDTWLNYTTKYLIAVNRNTQYIYVVKVFVIVWVIYIHATCSGGWNNQDRIRIEKWFVFFFRLSSGSHIENWHSVLRNGLVNASYTKLQVRNLGAEHCLCSRTVNLPWKGRHGLAVRPNRFFFPWMDDSFPLVGLAIGISQSRARWENFIFFRLDSMSLPVTGLRREEGGAVLSAVRRLDVRVNHLQHGGG